VDGAPAKVVRPARGTLMGAIVDRGIGFGIWWLTSPTRVLSTVGVVWLNTLGGNRVLDAIGGWSRDMTWGITKGAAKGAWSGLAFTARTTWSRLLLPVALWARPAAIHVGTRIALGATIAGPPVAVGAGVLATAAVIAGVHTAALQATGMVGPSAPKASDPSWFGGLEMNPYMFTMGTVV